MKTPQPRIALRPQWLRCRFPIVEVGCLLLASLLVMARQFASPHFASCVTDDSILQMSWTRQFSHVLREGVWLPRWLPDSNGGHGSPVFIFYSPLVYYVTAAFHVAGNSVILSMKLVRWLGLWLSGLALFLFARRRAGDRIGLAVALIYLLLPFHVLDIYYWSLYAEPWAWIWFPLILLFLQRMLEADSRGKVFPKVSLCFAGLILTHLVSAYMFCFVMAAYVVSCSPAKQRRLNCVRLLASAGAGLALAAFFLVPAFYERRFVHIEYSTLLPEFDFRNTFLLFPNPAVTAANSFQAKTILLLQVVTALQLGGALTGAALAAGLQSDGTWCRLMSFALWTGLCCLFLMSKASTWIWQLIPGLPQIQFSTRWLSIFTLMTALLMGAGFAGLFRDGPTTTLLVSLRFGFLTLALLTLGVSAFVVLKGCFLGADETRMAEMNLYNAPEYNPRTMPNWTQRVIAPEKEKWWVVEGSAQVKQHRWAAHVRELVIDAASPIRLKFRLYHYPGWVARVNGEPVPVVADWADGRISVRVPEGRHVLKVSFENTWWRSASLVLSGLTAAWFLIQWARSKNAGSRGLRAKSEQAKGLSLRTLRTRNGALRSSFPRLLTVLLLLYLAQVSPSVDEDRHVSQ